MKNKIKNFLGGDITHPQATPHPIGARDTHCFFDKSNTEYTASSSRALDRAIKCIPEVQSLGKASTIGIEISPTPDIIFTEGQKV